jgi:hypothetical protein
MAFSCSGLRFVTIGPMDSLWVRCGKATSCQHTIWLQEMHTDCPKDVHGVLHTLCRLLYLIGQPVNKCLKRRVTLDLLTDLVTSMNYRGVITFPEAGSDVTQ